jgi:CMP-N,N'-diacetyllegionaminic acid synthase
MTKGQMVVGVILARGGSKGLPGKNLAHLGGRPLLAYTILAAKQARTLDRVILTTDSPEIARVGRRYGAEVPFLRPAHLARDTTHTPPVIEHAVRYLERTEGCRVDIVVTLQPTSPFRRPEHIDRGVRMLAADPKLDSVIAVKEATIPPYWVFRNVKGRLEPFVKDGTDYFLRERQQLPPTFQPNGAVYVTRRKLLTGQGVLVSAFSGRSTGCFLMDWLTSVDIDRPMDLVVAKLLLKQHPELAGGRPGGRA